MTPDQRPCQSLWIQSLVIAGILMNHANGFVNVPHVRKPALQSTSTSVTWEPTHVLTDAFNRNPFKSDDEESAGGSSAPLAFFRDASVTSTAEAGDSSPPRQNLFSRVYSSSGNTHQERKPSSQSSGWVAKYIRSEQARRKVQAGVTVSVNNFLRDSGLLRGIMDLLVTIGTPSLAWNNPEIVPRFLQLTKDCIRIPYGEDAHWTQALDLYGSRMQAIDMYLPLNEEKPRGLLFFVHGGAWGSGLPWMYRLVAQPFLEQGMAVAVVGYRTFPDGDMKDQVQDLEMAAEKLTQQYPDLCTKDTDFGVCVMGHSSGAHIAMSMLANRLQQKLQQQQQTSEKDTMRIDSFIGLSAPYEISSHYEFETGRGLEELSPMKAACGYDKERLSDFSPVLKLFQQLIRRPLQVCQQVNDICPRMALIHGDQDDTVPLSSTRQAAHLLSEGGIAKCDDMYLAETGHSETVIELMLGGKTRDLVMDWLQKPMTASNVEGALEKSGAISESSTEPPVDSAPSGEKSELPLFA